MTRTIVTFMQRADGNVDFALLDSPLDLPEIGVNDLFDASGLAAATTAATRGAALVCALRKHTGVKAGLDAVLATPPGGGSAPLYLRMMAAAADMLAWEEIWIDDHTGFAALDRRWPVVRIAQREREVKVRDFEPPLHIVAVLSAAGRDLTGVPQLRGLLDAVAGSPVAADLRLHVISGEQAVLDAAQAAGVAAELIAPDPPGLARQITAADPDLLHLLCHGGAGAANVRTLAFGRPSDFDAALFDAGDAGITGSIRLTVPDLIDALRPCAPWLVVLSACQTAAAGPEGVERAMAHDLASGGVPAVIGMRRPVDITAADRFCGALYPEVLATIAAVLGVAGEQDVSWADTLTAPRQVLSGGNPPDGDEWTDPVLYVQADRLRVQRAPRLPAAAELSAADRAAARGRLDGFRGLLKTLDPERTDPALLAELRGRIAELEVLVPG